MLGLKFFQIPCMLDTPEMTISPFTSPIPIRLPAWFAEWTGDEGARVALQEAILARFEFLPFLAHNVSDEGDYTQRDTTLTGYMHSGGIAFVRLSQTGFLWMNNELFFEVKAASMRDKAAEASVHLQEVAELQGAFKKFCEEMKPEAKSMSGGSALSVLLSAAHRS